MYCWGRGGNNSRGGGTDSVKKEALVAVEHFMRTSDMSTPFLFDGAVQNHAAAISALVNQGASS